MKHILYVILLLIPSFVDAQAKYNSLEPIPYGDMEHWLKRSAKESGIIGGKVKELYEIGLQVPMKQGEYYKNYHGSPWASSSVIADVGVIKTSVTVFPEKRGNGYAARLESKYETVTVLGFINIKVIATGTIFLGTMNEPITSTKGADAYLLRGIPINKKPKGVVFDYKMRGVQERFIATGFNKKKLLGLDSAEVICIIQRRWEDKDGNIYAKRVGTLCHRMRDLSPIWKNAFFLPITYGEAAQRRIRPNDVVAPLQKEDNSRIYARNSRGEVKRIIEVGYAKEYEHPTHIMLSFSAGYGGAFVGSPGGALWVDNIKLAY
ncbi:MAG: PCMD domain-containing protein [Rikenellaceae bacterium]